MQRISMKTVFVAAFRRQTDTPSVGYKNEMILMEDSSNVIRLRKILSGYISTSIDNQDGTC